MEDPGGSEGFEHGGWQRPYFDQDLASGVRERLFASETLLLGRVTYEHFAAAWPSLTDEQGFADRMNRLPRYVASTTSEEPLAWNATLLTGEVAEAVAKLKQEPGGDLLVQGSGQLAQTLLHHNLIETCQLWVHPVVLGSGKRLFHDGSPPTTLRLVDSKTTSAGVAVLTLVPRRQNQRRVGLGPKRQRSKSTRVDLVNPPAKQQPREEVGGHGDQHGPFACPTDIRPDLLDAHHPRRGRKCRRHVLGGETFVRVGRSPKC